MKILLQILETIVLPGVAGGFVGTGCGIGLWPIYKQPKNIRRQLLLTSIGIVLMGIFYYLEFYLKPF